MHNTTSTHYTESDEQGIWTLELGGFRREDLVLEVGGAAVTLRGVRAEGSDSVSVSHSVSLPADADRERIRAELRDGTLIVTIPRGRNGEPRPIPIG